MGNIFKKSNPENKIDFKVQMRKIGAGLYGKMQNLSRVIVLPIAALPVAGLLLGIGGGVAKALEVNGGAQWVIEIFNVMKWSGDVVFANLGVIFAIAIAFGFAKASKGVAALSGFITFIVMTGVIRGIFAYNGDTGILGFDPWGLGSGQDLRLSNNASKSGFFSNILGLFPTFNASVLGGILVGWLVSLIHNKTYNIRMPRALAFFGGERFVPIVAIFLGIGMGITLFFAWPALLKFFQILGKSMGQAMNFKYSEEHGHLGQDFKPNVGGAFIALFFGITERLLIPTGLHHVQYTPFWFTEVGGVWFDDNGKRIVGAYEIFFAQFGSKGSGHFTQEVGTMFMSGRFAFMQWGYPFAALAMYQLARPENKKTVAGILLPAALTSFLTGITEPLLFSFLFVAPLCFLFHAFMAGISFMMAYCLNIVVGQGFAAGFIDFTAFGIVPEILGKQTGFYWVFVTGLIMAPAYYFGFYYIIKKKDYQTLGRERGEMATNLAVQSVQQVLDKSTSKAQDKITNLITGLGGVNNILDNSYEDKWLIVTLKDTNLYSEALIRLTGTKTVKLEDKKIKINYLDGAQPIYNELETQLIGGKEAKKQKIKGFSQQSIKTIIAALGGADNLDSVGNCATRLRVNVKDPSKVNLDLVKTTAPDLIAYGSNMVGKSVQIIYGGDASTVASQIDEELK